MFIYGSHRVYGTNAFFFTQDFRFSNKTLFTQLGKIESEKSKDFKLTVCPVRLGLITIAQLQLTDVFLKRTYEFDDFVQVFVVDQDRDDEQFEPEKFVQYGVEKITLS